MRGRLNLRTQQAEENVQRLQQTGTTSQSRSRMLPVKTAEQDHHNQDTGPKGDGGPSDNPDGSAEEDSKGTLQEFHGIDSKQ